jgi:hypothetical protein
MRSVALRTRERVFSGVHVFTGGEGVVDELKRRPSGAAVQCVRILNAMRENEWVSGDDFRPPTIDGGPEIRNVTPRVSELRRCHGIDSERGPDNCARYRLSWDRGDGATPFAEIVTESREVVADDAGAQLALEVSASPGTSGNGAGSAPRSAIYDDWDA